MGASECELIAMKLKEEEKENPNRRKVLERVVVAATLDPQRHHWGTVQAFPGMRQGAAYLAKDRFRVRVEGWVGDVVIPAEGWRFCDAEDCNGEIVIVTWSNRPPEDTSWGPAPKKSGHENSYWIEYVGQWSGATPRVAGPFGCTEDPVDHAMDDAGFREPGVDGGYALFDSRGNVVKTEA